MNAAGFHSMKFVIRCMDIGRSRLFYEVLMGLDPAEEWTDAQGSGCIYQLGEDARAGSIEVIEMPKDSPRYRDEFARPFESEKIDLQFRVPSLEAWVRRLKGKWDFDGPEVVPWGGANWIRLRDPDGVLIGLVEE